MNASSKELYTYHNCITDNTFNLEVEKTTDKTLRKLLLLVAMKLGTQRLSLLPRVHIRRHVVGYRTLVHFEKAGHLYY